MSITKHTHIVKFAQKTKHADVIILRFSRKQTQTLKIIFSLEKNNSTKIGNKQQNRDMQLSTCRVEDGLQATQHYR